MKFRNLKQVCITAIIIAGFVPLVGYSRELTALRINRAPVIDGKLCEECWSIAQPADNFKQLRTHESAKYPSIGYVLYDDENLYIGFKCFEPEMERLQKIIKNNKNEFKYNQGENVEIFLQPDLKHPDFIQFIVNTNGTRVHFGKGDLFSGKMNWEAAVFTGKDFFSIEVKIPFAAMQLSEGTSNTWGINLCRARMPSEARSTPFSSWSPVSSTFKSPDEFGRLIINKDFSCYFYKVQFTSNILKVENHTGKTSEIMAEVSTEKESEKIIQFHKDFMSKTGELKKFIFKPELDASMNIITLRNKKTGKILFQGASQCVDDTPDLNK